MSWKRVARVGRWVGTVVVAVELLYLLAANGVLFSGLAERVANAQPDVVQLAWDRAYSLWPGRVTLTGVRVRLQDPMLQVGLTAESAKVNVTLWELLRKRLHASSVHAVGVTCQLVPTVDGTAGRERRLALFPVVEGFASPPLRPDPLPPLPAQPLEGTWTVQLDGLDATLTEVWALEFRYRGAVHVTGSVGAAGTLAPWPIRRLQLGPLQADVAGGDVSVGERVVARGLAAHVELTSAPIDLPSTAGREALEGLDLVVRLDVPIADVGLVELYVDGARATGHGQLTAALQLAGGVLRPGGAADLSLAGLDGELHGAHFTGDAQAKVTVADDGQPTLYATAGGSLRAPLDTESIEVALTGVTAKLVLAHGDVSRAQALAYGSATAAARVEDARPLVCLAGAYVPVIAPIVLGDGPLIATATGYLTPEYTLVRLTHAELGDAAFEGAAVQGAHGWTGAGAGHFGQIPVALRLTEGEIVPVLFMSDGWLGVELRKAGIEPDDVTLTEAHVPSN